MKKISIIFFLAVISLTAFSQTIYQPLGSTFGNNMQGVNHLKFIQLPRGIDTTLNGKLDTAGMLFYKTVDKSLWLRVPRPASTLNKWVKIADSSGTSGGSSSLTATYVGFGSGSNTLTGSSDLVWNGTGLGIFTTPTVALDVVGDVKLGKGATYTGGLIGTNEATGVSWIGDYDGASGGISLYVDDPNGKVVFSGLIQAPFYGSGTNTGTPTYNLSVDASGNVIETNTLSPVDTSFQWSVLSTLNTPSGSAVSGDVYRVGTSPTGAFVGHANEIATYNGATYTFQTASAGDLLYDANTYLVSKFNGSTWTVIGKPPHIQGGDRFGATAIIGTADNQAVGIRTNGVNRINIAKTTGAITLIPSSIILSGIPAFGVGTFTDSLLSRDPATGAIRYVSQDHLGYFSQTVGSPNVVYLTDLGSTLSLGYSGYAGVMFYNAGSSRLDGHVGIGGAGVSTDITLNINQVSGTAGYQNISSTLTANNASTGEQASIKGGITYAPTSGVSTNTNIGVYGYASASGSGTLNNKIIGVKGVGVIGFGSTGTIDNLTGVVGRIELGSGNVAGGIPLNANAFVAESLLNTSLSADSVRYYHAFSIDSSATNLVSSGKVWGFYAPHNNNYHWLNGKTYFGGVDSVATSIVQIAAGSTTLAPLKLTAGTNLTTPEDGAIEYGSSHLYFTIGSTRYQIDQQSGSGGSVTSVGFTGGLISVANPTTTPAFTVAGTSGGGVYFSSTSTWASTGLLAANAIMIGGGAGTAYSTTTTGTGVLTALGVNVGSAGAFVTFNGALGTPSSGTLTNATGLPTTGLTGTLQAAQEPAHTGDVTNSAGSLALTIANNAVTAAKLQQGTAYTFLANNTGSTANYADNTFKANARQTYAGTIAWTGTPPSGTLNQTYSWTQVGNMVTLVITVNYSVAGTTNQSVTFTLPSDCPSPSNPTGTGAASTKVFPGFGYIDAGITANPPVTRCTLQENAAANGWIVSLVAASQSATVAQGTVIYFTN